MSSTASQSPSFCLRVVGTVQLPADCHGNTHSPNRVLKFTTLTSLNICLSSPGVRSLKDFMPHTLHSFAALFNVLCMSRHTCKISSGSRLYTAIHDAASVMFNHALTRKIFLGYENFLSVLRYSADVYKVTALAVAIGDPES